MLGPDRNEHRSCRVKSSSCIKVQVNIEEFRCNRSGRVASRTQEGSNTKCLLRSKVKTYQSPEEATRESIGARSTETTNKLNPLKGLTRLLTR